MRNGRKRVVVVPPTVRNATRPDFDAIVIGSGVGGSVAAGLLAHAGARVLVIEKNEALGGILASYERDGFKIDVGSHLIAHGAKGPISHALHHVGAKAPRFLTHPLPVRSRGIFQIDAPAHRSGLFAVALEAAQRLALPPADALRLGRMMFQVMTLTEPELRRWDRRTLDEFVQQYTSHPGAYFLFSFLASIFFVLPPWMVSAGESIRALRTLLLAYSLSYVEGGMDSIAHAMLAPVVKGGGEIIRGRRVVSIARASLARHGDTLEVTTEEGAVYRAPHVACNMAPRDMLALWQGDVPDDYRARVADIQPSGSAHQVKLALRRPLVDEGCIIGGVSLSGLTLQDLSIELMQRTVDCIAEGSVSDPLAVYAPVPTNYDPSLAPDGAQLIVASIYGPTIDNPADPPEIWKARSMAALEAIIPGLHDELLFAEFTPIPSVGRWMGKRDNAAICNGQFPGQVGDDRLSVITPLPGLFLCGDGAGGRGIGTELAARSAMETVAAIQVRKRVAA